MDVCVLCTPKQIMYFLSPDLENIWKYMSKHSVISPQPIQLVNIHSYQIYKVKFKSSDICNRIQRVINSIQAGNDRENQRGRASMSHLMW